MDASLGAPSLHRVLDLPNSPGLAEVLEGREDLLRTAHAASDGSGLVVLLAGRPTAAPATALRGQGLRRLVQTAQPDTTIVSLNGRTPAGVRDLVVAQSPDAVVLAGDPLRLTRRQLSTAADSVSAIGATVVAVVLCGATKEGLRQRFRSIVDATVHREIDEPDAAELSPVTEGRALAAEVELPGQARMFSSRR